MNKILVVEDSKSLRDVLCFSLKKAGYEVAEAEDGMDGLQKVVEFQPDLILSDIRMPNLDGIEFIKVLRKDSSVLPIPFIFLTVLDKPEDIKKGIDLGAVDYVTKPPNTDILLARIRRQLEQLAQQRSHEQEKLRLKKAYEYSEKLTELKNINGKQIADNLVDKLAIISGNAQLFQKEVDEIVGRIDSLNNIGALLSHVQKMKKMTDSIVDNSQAVSDGLNGLLKEMTVKGSDVNIRHVVGNVLISRRYDAFLKHLEMPLPHMEGDEKFIVTGDEHLFEKSIDTILNILIQYAPLKGVIGVTLEKSDENGFYLKLNCKGPILTDEQKKQIFCLPETPSSSKTSAEIAAFCRLRIVKDDLFSQYSSLGMDEEYKNGVGFKIGMRFKTGDAL